MQHYETLFVIKPTLTEEEIRGQIDRVKNIIADNGGDLQATDEMGMRRLAYPIDKNERGFYCVVYYKANGETVHELERQLRYNEDILRFMTVKYTNKKEIAQFEKMVAKANGTSTETKEQESSANAQSEEA